VLAELLPIGTTYKLLKAFLGLLHSVAGGKIIRFELCGEIFQTFGYRSIIAQATARGDERRERHKCRKVVRREGEDRLFIGGLDLFWMWVNVCGWLQQKSAELNETHEQNTFINDALGGTHSFG
jgi:hypothetical protein